MPLFLVLFGYIARMARAGTVEALDADYTRTAVLKNPEVLAAMNAISKDHAGAASGILVTLSGLGATLGVAVTGAVFQELQTNRTVSFAAGRLT